MRKAKGDQYTLGVFADGTEWKADNPSRGFAVTFVHYAMHVCCISGNLFPLFCNVTYTAVSIC
jgi:hypothetical protein